MAYTLQHTNRSLDPIVVPDGQLDKSTSLTYVGKTVQNYGGIIDQNFLQLLENFASTIEPGTPNVRQGTPIRGQIWYDTGNNEIKFYDGLGFKKIGGAMSGPVDPQLVKSATGKTPVISDGDLWVDTSTTSNPLLKMRANNDWITVGPAGAQATVTGELILDNHLQTHKVITFNIDGKRHAILSNDEVTYRTRTSTTDSSPIPGFYTVGPGFNINDTGDVLGNRFWGTATGAERILLPQPPGLGDVFLTAHDFIRANVPGFTTSSITVKNNLGLTLGSGNQVTMSITNTDYNINNIATNSNIKFNTKDSGGTAHNVLSLYGNGNATFGADLNLIGSLHTSQISTGTITLTGNYPSTTSSDGTLIVTGGIGLSGNINAGGSHSTFTGSIAVNSTFREYTVGRKSLTINGSTDSVLYMQGGGVTGGYLQSTGNEMQIISSGANPLYLTVPGSNSIFLNTNGSQYGLVLNNLGRVGINTNTITHTLEVNGTINASGNISEAGNPTLNTANFNNYVPTLNGVAAYGTWDINITGSSSGLASHATEAYLLNLHNDGNKFISYQGWAGASPGYQYTGTDNGIFGFSADSGVVDVYADGDFYANSVNKVLNAGNFNAYTPTLTGTGAYGTWPINISGTAPVASVALGLSSTNDYNVQSIAASLNMVIGQDVEVQRNLIVAGYISAAGDVYAFNTSDRNLKTKIKPIKNALDKVCKLSGNTFEWIPEHLETRPENLRKAPDVGVIAQEVETVLPEAVMTRPDGTLAVDYDKIVPLLIEAIKELRAELEDIKKPSLMDRLKGKK